MTLFFRNLEKIYFKALTREQKIYWEAPQYLIWKYLVKIVYYSSYALILISCDIAHLQIQCFTGLFITSCFVTTKKVRGLFKERFSNRRSRSVEPQTNSARDQPTVGITDVERAEGSTIVPREQGRTNSQRR